VERRRDVASHGRDWVAVILAIGLATAINSITFAALYEAIFKTGSSGLSENATQILTGGFGAIAGILGGYVGFRAGVASRSEKLNDERPDT
jgi:hypothetical protein